MDACSVGIKSVTYFPMPLRFSKAKSSFTRDFTVLTVAVGFLLVMLGVWIIYATYVDYRRQLLTQMHEGSLRLDRAVTQDVEQASYLLESIGRQVLHASTDDPEAIARLLRSFDTEGGIFNLFAWSNKELQIVATNTGGKLARPLDISDRDYAKKSLLVPWRVHIGRPVEGRITGKWVLPLALGVYSLEGNYLGSVLASINIDRLTQQLRMALANENINFGIITSTYLTVTESAEMADFINSYFPIDIFRNIENSSKIWEEFSSEDNDLQPAAVTMYQRSTSAPYVFLLSINIYTQLRSFITLLEQRMTPLLLIAIFMGLALLAVRNRIIKPLADLSIEADKIIRGEAVQVNVKGPLEIVFLGRQLQQIGSFLQERRRIEFEQKAKLAFLKRAKDTAELSNRVKVDFLTSMSHEFRIPLNTIAGFIELMKNEVYGAIGNERYRQYVVDIHGAVNALQSLVGDVIALSKAESSQSESQEKPIDLQLVVARCIRLLADKMKEANVTVENRIREDIPRLRVDEGRLRQIIQNLLFNALSHTPPGGSIVVDAHVTEDKLHQPVFEIVISDFGAKRLPGNFEDTAEVAPRKRGTQKGQKPGNLGVPLTRALVAMQQATLEVESPPGKATTVTVRYPKEKIVL